MSSRPIKRRCPFSVVGAVLGVVLLAVAPRLTSAQEVSPAFAKALKLAREDEARRVALVARISKTVVAIFPAAPGEAKAAPSRQGSGSGVIIDAKGHALTNYHVVQEAKRVNVGLSNGRVYAGTVIGRDPTGDIAVVQLEGGPFPFAKLGDSDALHIGDWVLAMGNPFGLATDFKPTVTQGIVSGLHRYLPGNMGGDLIYTDSIQVDAPINPGNSGGPLFNARGELIGINGRVSARPSRGKVNTGVGFAIPINQIKGFLPGLIKGGRVHHAVLGVELSETASDVTIARVVPGMSAERAGLRPGDVVRRFRGFEIKTNIELINRIGILPADTRVRVVVERKGRPYDIEVVLGKRPTATETITATALEASLKKPPGLADVRMRLLPDAIARRFVEATGGYEAHAEIEDTITTARVRLNVGGRVWVSGTLVQYDVDSSRIRHETVYRMGTRTRRQITAFDGFFGWSYTNGIIQDMDEDGIAAIKAELTAFDDLFRPDGWKTPRARYAGLETLDGRTLAVVTTTDAVGGERRWGFDVKTWLLVRYVRTSESGATRDDRLSDYRRVGRTLQPFAYVGYVNARRQQTIQVQTIEINRGITDETLSRRPAARLSPKVH